MTATAPAGSGASASDLSFVTNLYNVVDFDREVTGELLTKNSDPRFAGLAQHLLAQGNGLEARVAPIAARDGILPPNDQRFVQRVDLQAKIASVMADKPINFDQEPGGRSLFSRTSSAKRPGDGQPARRCFRPILAR